ncbi:MAG: AI-2E family transporter [Anaerolineales bacterium]|jgi:predicted PurR-regulated permease PerM|nr:AI-2E family transporter [Anaerolineales bacterium]
MSPQWSTSTKYIILALVLAAVFATVQFARPLIGPLVISALLAFVLAPLVDKLAAYRRIQRDSAVLIVYLIFLALLIAVPSIIAPLIINPILSLSIDLLAVEVQVEAFLSEPIMIGNLSFNLPVQFTQDINQFLRGFIGQATTGAFDFLGRISSNLAWLLVILVATFYFLKDTTKLLDWFVELIPQDYQDDARIFLKELNRIWSAYLRGQLTLMTLIAIMTSVGMTAVGLRGAVGVGILAGILDIIPSVGPLIAGVIAGLVALIFGSSYLDISNLFFALIVVLIFLVIQQIENIWLRPQIMGQTLRLHPGVIFVGVIGALVLSGVLGALVIIPLMASVAVLGRYIKAKLRGQDPWRDETPSPGETDLEK